MYGTAKITRRENWKGHYYAVSRKKNGQFQARGKWEHAGSTRQVTKRALQKKGITEYEIRKEGKAYIEKYVEEERQKIKQKVGEEIEEEEWIDYGVETP